MAATWEHPELGRFKWDVDRWSTRITAPGFDAFSYDYGDEDAAPNGTYDLHFHAKGERGFPSEEAVAVAQKVLSNPAAIVAKVSAALWDDFNGRGPGSGMWWHGDLDSLSEAMDGEELPPPAGADDVRKVLQLSDIIVRMPDYRFDRPIVELNFVAPFEEEHNVGVLTDGEAVLGIGYYMDVAPFGYAGGRSEEE